MCKPYHLNLSALEWRRLTPGQQLRLTRLIVEQARMARARAIRDQLRLPLGLARRTAAAVAALWRAGARRRQRRQAIRELGALDDRALRDLGLGRSEIEAAVDGVRTMWQRADAA